MTIRNGNHCFAYRCACGTKASGYASESAAARAEQHHCEQAPSTHRKAAAK